MNWIFDHFQIVILVALGIGSVVKSVFEARSKRAAEREIDWNPDSGVPLDEDTSYRKTLPSPPLARTTVPPRLDHPVTPPAMRLAGYEAEAANETAAALKHQLDLAARLRQIRETKATTTGGAAATRARVAAKGVAKPFPQGPASLRGRLRDHGEIRRAIVMREILDPPVGLR